MSADFTLLELTDTVMITDSGNTSNSYEVSVQAIKTWGHNNWNADSFILCHRAGDAGYFIHFLNWNANIQDLYLADYTYLQDNKSGFSTPNVSFTSPTNGSYGWNGSKCVSLGFSSPKIAETVDNIEYSSYWNYYNSVFPPKMYIDKTISGTIYYNGGLPITYNWQSVPSISGKNGILSLVTLDSESINDGEPVSGAAVSVFDQNPASGNNVKDIVDGNTPLIPSAVDVTAAFIISNPPVGELASRILAAKKDSIPESIEDADKTVSIPANASNATMPGLDENSQYYFAIFVADATGDTAVSDPKDIYTSGDEGWSFDYTGEIQTFVAPKTGIYSLETWGAQGGDATDGTNTARGGYGAYAYGEVLLQQGETLYINVGGQNGYGGGGEIINRRALTSIKVGSTTKNLAKIDKDTLATFQQQDDYVFKQMGEPRTPDYVLGIGDSFISTNTASTTLQNVNDGTDVKWFVTDSYYDSTRGSYVRRFGFRYFDDSESENYVSTDWGNDTFYFGVAVDDNTKETWVYMIKHPTDYSNYSQIKVFYHNEVEIYNAFVND